MIFRFTLIHFILILSTSAWSEETLRFAFSNKSHPMSYGEDGGSPEGIFSSLISLVDLEMPNHKFDLRAYNWQRAQVLVHEGQRDAYCTYPSEERKRFSLFTQTPLYVQDYGYIIYNKKSKRAKAIESVQSLEDLAKFEFLSQAGVKWEEDNLPKNIKRIYVNSLEQLLHFLFRRNEGDFFVMPPSQVFYYAKEFGYRENIGIKKVNFIPNSNVVYHIGITRQHPKAAELIKQLDSVLNSSKFNEKKKKVLSSFGE